MSPVVMGCDACRQTTSADGCPAHSTAIYPSGVYTAIYPSGVYTASMLAHRHHWTFDKQDPSIGFIYHCDEHDPPVVRVVQEWTSGSRGGRGQSSR